jgi:enediyne biosynthesis protein E4
LCATSLLGLASSLTGQAGGARPFVDITLESGVDFVHDNGATGELLLPEVTGSGGALFDYDNDGDLDVFAVQGAALKPGTRQGAQPAPAPSVLRGRLFRNDLAKGKAGRPHFIDVTTQSGILAGGYGMGAATGDVDNDGWIDLLVTNLGSNQMFRNNGDGSFDDVTVKTGISDPRDPRPRWGTSATFFDYDRDGWLDLFVANYVHFGIEMKRECFSRTSARDYCNPVVYDPLPAQLFHNDGDGTFTDVSVRSGITRSIGRGLGVVATDLNADGWTDLYVANDGDPNHLLINQRGTGTFKDEGLLAGVAVNRMGHAQGSMGVDLGDVDGDGDEDLFVTNLDNESNTYYAQSAPGLFEDRTIEAGLFRLGFTGFGTRFLDYDNDGWLDLLVVNGAVRQLGDQVRQGVPYPLKQRNQLLRNDRGRKFVDVTNTAGPAFDALEVGRGAAVGDLDNDGDPDVVVFNNSGRTRVLLNDVGHLRHWMGVRVIDSRHLRDAMQTRVELVRPNGRSLWRRVQTDGSYCSASDPRVLFGLGESATPQTIRVHWAGGQVEEFRNLAVGRYWILESGKAPR